jgi:AcrR family transcriptional regulator
MARTGRRPGPSTSRDAILGAARRRFAEAGYDATTLRAVAADAGVDPAVVVHFFGSKEGLFRAAVGWPFDPSAVVARLVAGGPEDLAARAAGAFLGVWEDPATQAPLLALLRSAMTHEGSAALLREFAVRRLVGQVAGVLEGPEAELRVELAVAQLLGVALLRHALRVEPLASARVDELVELLAPALGRYLDDGVRAAAPAPGDRPRRRRGPARN